MRILGISGIEDALLFKRQEWPDIQERENRIVQGQDSAAVLTIDGEIVAAVAEERFDRLKHSARFPVNAIRYCLDRANLALSEVDELAHSFDYEPYSAVYRLNPYAERMYEQALSKRALLRRIRRHFPETQLPDERITQVPHHLAHASSAYYGSGWDECLVIVADAMGEVDGISVWRGHDGTLSLLRTIGAENSIGVFYSVITLHLGFDFNSDEYKIMGLAPYGDPDRFAEFFTQAVRLTPEGGIQIPLLKVNRSPAERETLSRTRQHLETALLPHRAPDDEITREHQDAAAGLQRTLEDVIQHIASHFAATTGLRRLAMAGGVALNCSANGKLLRSRLFDEIFVQPAAGDDGAALGAALWRGAVRGERRAGRMPVPYLGPECDDQACAAALAGFADRIEVRHFPTAQETCREAAAWIARRAVIGWYRGRAEFGPRALGNRSILADPGCPEMRDRVNALVKMREAFRPFAPAVTAGEADRWFDIVEGADLSSMLFVVPVRDQHRERFPAVTHIDGSARVQIVTAESNPVFHALLKAIGETTGTEMVLNTSFNVKGQPIVNTPDEAIDTFLTTGIDALFLGDALVQKRSGAT